MIVTLTDTEIAEADLLIETIKANNIAKNREFRLDRAINVPRDVNQMKLDGFRAEKAASKALGLKWNNHIYTDEEFRDKENRGTDLACNLEVKCTTWKNGCIIINLGDLESAMYVLVIVNGKHEYEIKGWCYGHQGIRSEFKRTGACGQPAYYVPQTELNPMSTLLKKTDSFMKKLL